MPPTTSIVGARSTRTAKLHTRLSTEAKQKLQSAAQSAGWTVSQFVRERADEALADRPHFGLDPDRWNAFTEALDALLREIPRLANLLQESSAFERRDQRWPIQSKSKETPDNPLSRTTWRHARGGRLEKRPAPATQSNDVASSTRASAAQPRGTSR
jgi:uncharacterized protein (DUF1778 family)